MMLHRRNCRPYLIEGLDCSGKKTLARHLASALGERCMRPISVVIGPLVRSPLQYLDCRLTYLAGVGRSSRLEKTLKRSVYLLGPLVDGILFCERNGNTTVKVSSHYRAWAKAIIDSDTIMTNFFEAFRSLLVCYGGCAFLTTPFQVRILRHRSDFENGRTTKVENYRFLEYDQSVFEEWDLSLLRLLQENVPDVLVLNTDGVEPEVLTEIVLEHFDRCRRRGLIQ